MKLRYCLLPILIFSHSYGAKSLKECSLILWPKYDWLHSNIEYAAETSLSDSDYIIYPGALGFKESFRVSNYSINMDRVLLQMGCVPGPDFDYQMEKKQNGIGGIWINEDNQDARFEGLNHYREFLRDTLTSKNKALFYCLSREALDRPANIDFLADKSDRLVVYFDRALLLDSEKTVAYFKKQCERIREKSQAKIYAAVKLKLEDNDADELIQLFNQFVDQIDGIAIVWEGGEQQTLTAIKLMKKLRA